MADLELGEHAQLGRSGGVCGRSVSLEQQRYAGNRPTLERVVGFVANNDDKDNPSLFHTYCPVGYDSLDLSGGGNGYARWHDLPNGFYCARDVLGTGSRTYTYFVAIFDDGVAADRTPICAEMRDEIRAALPAEYAAACATCEAMKLERDLAQRLTNAVLAERKEVRAVTDADLIAEPEFASLPATPDAWRIALRDADGNEDDLVALLALPRRYVVRKPVSVSGDDGPAAIAAARQRIEEEEAAKQAEVERRAKAVQAATAEAEALDLPALTGSPKQVAWALQIRGEVARASPRHNSLRRATTAKYWIENRRELQRNAELQRATVMLGSDPTKQDYSSW